jgi:hypothetical protein
MKLCKLEMLINEYREIDFDGFSYNVTEGYYRQRT